MGNFINEFYELMAELKPNAVLVPDYIDEDVSDMVVKIIQSYTDIARKMVWCKS